MKRKIVIGIAAVAIMAIAIIGVGLVFCDLLSLKGEIQDEKLYEVFSLVNIAGADDLTGETAYVRLDPIAVVDAGEPLVVTGTSNRKDGYTIVITCIGKTMELTPQTTPVENGTFRATFDTTDAVTGEYTVKADDGDGHVAEEETFITGTGVQEIVEGVEEAVEALEEKAAAAAVELGKKVEEEAAAAVAAEVERLAEEAARPEPTPSLQESIDEIKKLPKGRILFNPPKEMKVDKTELVDVRITKNMTEELTRDLKGRGDPIIEEIKASTSMKVRLTGINFDIKPQNGAAQAIESDKFTKWVFYVTPLKSGIQTLYITVYVIISIPGYDDQEKEHEVEDWEINVKVNPLGFLTRNWQFIVGTVIAIVALIITLIGIRKKKG
jgi:hypothetical protein